MSATYRLSERTVARRLACLQEAIEWAGAQRLASILEGNGQGLLAAYRLQRFYLRAARDLRVQLVEMRATA